MNNALSQVLSILIGALIFALLPVYCLWERSQMIEESRLLSETTYLVDSICNTGFLSEDMYRDFQRQLSVLNQVYEIQIQVEQDSYGYWAESDEEGTDGAFECYREYIGTEDILENVYDGDPCYFSRGDFIRIQLVQTTKQPWDFYVRVPRVAVYYGSRVKYEAY